MLIENWGYISKSGGTHKFKHVFVCKNILVNIDINEQRFHLVLLPTNTDTNSSLKVAI
jgi:hypothetical protein